jgi:hypothetical protein
MFGPTVLVLNSIEKVGTELFNLWSAPPKFVWWAASNLALAYVD